LHEAQAEEQSLSQHTPSAQKPELQSPPDWQVAPMPFRPMQAPLTQKAPGAQSPLLAQNDWQVAALHA
jgi:hypothetical protein